MGVNCLFGAVSLLILGKLGGLAFDKIDKSVPFLFVAFCSAVLLLVVLFTRSKIDVIPKHSNKDYIPENEQEGESDKNQTDSTINKI